MKRKKKQLMGKVFSIGGEKTVKVKVCRDKVHKKYLKPVVVYTTILAHYENLQLNISDKVIIEEHNPFSKKKRFNIINKIS